MKYVANFIYLTIRVLICLTIWPAMYVAGYVAILAWSLKPIRPQDAWARFREDTLGMEIGEYTGDIYHYPSWKDWLLDNRTVTGNQYANEFRKRLKRKRLLKKRGTV